MRRHLLAAVLTLGLVSPALGGERDDEIIEYGRLECLVKYQGSGVNPVWLADEMDIDLKKICDCDGRALAQMSTLGQDIFMTNYKEMNKRKHLPFPEEDLNRRATYINQHCPKKFVYEAIIRDRQKKIYEGMTMRITSPEGIIRVFVMRDGKLIEIPNPSQSD